MSWLTAQWLFWLGFPLFIVAEFAFLLKFFRDPDSGKRASEEIAEQFRRIGEETSGRAAIREHLDRLLRQGYDHGVLVLTFKGTDSFIQFRKYIHAKGDCGLELGFPDAEWSRDHFPRLPEWCERNGFAFHIDPDSEGGGLDFLHVDTGDDLDEAVRLAEGIMTDVFGLQPDTRFSYQFDSVSELGEEVDDPTAAPLSPAAAFKRQQEHISQTTGHSMRDGCLHAFVGGITTLAFLGLEYSLLWRAIWWATGGGPDWGAAPMSLFGIELAARRFEIVCLLLVLAGVAYGFTGPARRVRSAEGRHWSEAKRSIQRRRRARFRYIYLPLALTALALFWLRG